MRLAFYTQCWSASRHSFAMIARVPHRIPVPVDAPNAMSLLRYRRDFGIIAAIVAAIALAAASTAAAVSMTHTVQTAQTLNSLSTLVLG